MMPAFLALPALPGCYCDVVDAFYVPCDLHRPAYDAVVLVAGEQPPIGIRLPADA